MRQIKVNELTTIAIREDVTDDYSGHLIVDGHEVPHITVNESEDRKRGEAMYWLNLDRRFGVHVAESELGRLAPFLANAMAVTAGFTCHGPNSSVRNPHGPSVIGRVVDGDLPTG